MKFTYTIEGFNPIEGVFTVRYSPEDTTKESIVRIVPITSDNLTQQEIDQQIINRAPIEKWNMNFPSFLQELVGASGQSDISQVNPFSNVQPGVFTYPDGSTSVPPPPMPDDGKTYQWDNPTWSWVEVTTP